MTTPAASPLARFVDEANQDPVRAEWVVNRKIETPTYPDDPWESRPKTDSAIFVRLMDGISPDQVHLVRPRMPPKVQTQALLDLLELSLILPHSAA